jgi:hypothetical protein
VSSDPIFLYFQVLPYFLYMSKNSYISSQKPIFFQNYERKKVESINLSWNFIWTWQIEAMQGYIMNTTDWFVKLYIIFLWRKRYLFKVCWNKSSASRHRVYNFSMTLSKDTWKFWIFLKFFEIFEILKFLKISQKYYI